MNDSQDPRLAKMSDLFLASLKAIGVTPTKTLYSPEDFSIRKGWLYRPSEDAPAVRLKPKVEWSVELAQDALALEGAEGLAKAYGDMYGKIIAEICAL